MTALRAKASRHGAPIMTTAPAGGWICSVLTSEHFLGNTVNPQNMLVLGTIAVNELACFNSLINQIYINMH